LPEVLEEVAAKPPVETRKQTLETQPTLASKEIEIDFRGEAQQLHRRYAAANAGLAGAAPLAA
jgi:hypothetical protein